VRQKENSQKCFKQSGDPFRLKEENSMLLKELNHLKNETEKEEGMFQVYEAYVAKDVAFSQVNPLFNRLTYYSS